MHLSRLGINALDNVPKGSLTVLLSPAVPSSEKWLMDSRLFSPPSLLPKVSGAQYTNRVRLSPPKTRSSGVSVPVGVTLVLGNLLSGGCCGFNTCWVALLAAHVLHPDFLTCGPSSKSALHPDPVAQALLSNIPSANLCL